MMALTQQLSFYAAAQLRKQKSVRINIIMERLFIFNGKPHNSRNDAFLRNKCVQQVNIEFLFA